MKQINPRLSLWLEKTDQHQLLIKIIQLCNDSALYILDEKHHVLLWSTAAQKLSGLKEEDLLGLACPKNYDISETLTNTENLLTVDIGSGEEIRLIQFQQTLVNSQGDFLGAICLLKQQQQVSIDTSVFNKVKSNNFHGILSRSPQMRPVFQIIHAAAKTEAMHHENDGFDIVRHG